MINLSKNKYVLTKILFFFVMIIAFSEFSGKICLSDELEGYNFQNGFNISEIQDPKNTPDTYQKLVSIECSQSTNLLIEALNSDSQQIRKKATVCLGEKGDIMAIEPLKKLLRDLNSVVRSAAAVSLGKIPDLGSVPELMIVLGDTDKLVRKSAAQSLEDLGISGAVNFNRCLDWSDVAINEFVRKNDPKIIKLIIEIFPKWPLDLQKNVVWILGKVQNNIVKEFLIDNINNRYSKIREASAWSLYKYDVSELSHVFISTLDDQFYSVREAAAYALGRAKSLKGLNELIATMREDEHPKVREAAVWALGNKCEDATLSAIHDALYDDNENVRIAAASVLGKLGDDHSINALAKLLKDNSTKVRMTAVDSIYQIGGDQSVYQLAKALLDPEPTVRRSVAKKLGDLGNKLAVDQLTDALSDEDFEVRRISSKALENLGFSIGSVIYSGVEGDREALGELVWLKDNRVNELMLKLLKINNRKIRNNALWYLSEVKEIRAYDEIMEIAGGFHYLDRIYGMSALLKLLNKETKKVICSFYKILTSFWSIIYFLIMAIITWIIIYLSYSFICFKSIMMCIKISIIIYSIIFILPSLII